MTVIDGWTPATGTVNTICAECGVTSVSYPTRRFRETIMEHHDYMPVTYVIQLKPGTSSTYIVPVALEPIARRIRSLDRGAGFRYAFDVALRGDDFVQRTLDADDRIEEWHTVVLFAPDETVVESAVVCKFHVHFVDVPQDESPQMRGNMEQMRGNMEKPSEVVREWFNQWSIEIGAAEECLIERLEAMETPLAVARISQTNGERKCKTQ